MTSLKLARQILESAGVENVAHEANHEPSFWLRCRLATIDRDCINGRLNTCRHWSPLIPGVIALWAPDTVWCQHCTGHGSLKLEGAADTECDRCGDQADPIVVCTIAGRHAVVLFGLCADCGRREAAA